MSKRLFVFALLVSMAWTAGAQLFRVSVVAPPSLGRNFEMVVYDNNATPLVLKPAGKKGIVFTGTVRGVAYAELRHRKIARPLPFFVENSEITIRYNAHDPDASPITGSRTNSIYRYQIEQCGTADMECLSLFVAENPSSPVSPYIIDRYMAGTADREMVENLYATLSGEACSTYHYRRLAGRLEAQAASSAGNPLPPVIVGYRNGKTWSLDTLMSDRCFNALVVGASYCKQCSDARAEIGRTFPAVNVVGLDVDSLAGGWDAPLMQQLDIDHIPFILLVGADRRIVARDIRIWELGRIMDDNGKPKNQN